MIRVVVVVIFEGNFTFDFVTAMWCGLLWRIEILVDWYMWSSCLLGVIVSFDIETVWRVGCKVDSYFSSSIVEFIVEFYLLDICDLLSLVVDTLWLFIFCSRNYFGNLSYILIFDWRRLIGAMGCSSSKPAKSKGKGKKAVKEADTSSNGHVKNGKAKKGKETAANKDKNANGHVAQNTKAETRTETVQETDKDSKELVNKNGQAKKGKVKDKVKKEKVEKGKEVNKNQKNDKDKEEKHAVADTDNASNEQAQNSSKHKTENQTIANGDKNTNEQIQKNDEPKEEKNGEHKEEKQELNKSAADKQFEKNPKDNKKGKTPPKVAKKNYANRLSNISCNDNSNNHCHPTQREQERERTLGHQASPDVSKKPKSNGHVSGESEGQRALENVLKEQIKTLEQEKYVF